MENDSEFFIEWAKMKREFYLGMETWRKRFWNDPKNKKDLNGRSQKNFQDLSEIRWSTYRYRVLELQRRHNVCESCGNCEACDDDDVTVVYRPCEVTVLTEPEFPTMEIIDMDL